MDASNPQHSLFLSLSLAVSFCVCLFHNIFERILPIKCESLFLCLNWLWILVDINGTKSKYMATEQLFSPPITRNTLSLHRIVPIFFGEFCYRFVCLIFRPFQFVLPICSFFYSTLFIFLSLIFNHFFSVFFFYFVLLLDLMEISHFYFGWNTHKKCWDCETQARVQHFKVFLDLQRVIFV